MIRSLASALCPREHVEEGPDVSYSQSVRRKYEAVAELSDAGLGGGDVESMTSRDIRNAIGIAAGVYPPGARLRKGDLVAVCEALGARPEGTNDDLRGAIARRCGFEHDGGPFRRDELLRVMWRLLG